ncbi:MAG TPA: hypothetical protein VGP72_21510 [Planctomycetota bacterium]|jgi:hypothetical protein
MSELPKKRGLFQFHLSTATLMMLVAAGMLWVNLQEHRFLIEKVTHWNGPVGGGSVRYSWRGYGVPFGWAITRTEVKGTQPPATPPLPAGITYNGFGLIGDLGVAVAVILVAGIWCERRIRREERRQ